MRQPTFEQENCLAREFAKSGMFLIIGGMFGNLMDRLFRNNGVVDFIQIKIFENSTPIFNFADVVIYIGEICLIVAWFIILYDKFKEKFNFNKTK